MKFERHEVIYVGTVCARLFPLERKEVSSGDTLALIFPLHDLCFIKALAEVRENKNEEYRTETVISLHYCHFDNEQNLEVFHAVMEPWFTIEEAAFGLMAYVSSQLPKHLINDKFYEVTPIQIH